MADNTQNQAADPYASIATPAAATSPAVTAAPADPYASIATPNPAPLAPPAGVMDRSIEGVKQFAAPLAAAIKEPETPTEHLIMLTAGPGALAAYRAAHGLITSADNMVKATPATYKQALDDFKRTHQEFANKDYRNAASSAVSTLADVGGIIDPVTRNVAGDVRELSEGARPGGNLATPLVRQGLGAAAAGLGGEALEADNAATQAAAKTLRVNPFRAIIQGERVAQAPAEAAVRAGVEEGTNVAGTASPTLSKSIAESPIAKNGETVLDEPQAAIATKEKAAYDAIDKTAGFDLKEAKLQLKNDQYNLKQLGNTPADQASAKTLKASIADSTKRISDAEAKLKTAGIDPKAGDVFHTQRMAGEDVQKALVKNTGPDGTINAKGLAKDFKNLRFNKRGDRLAQYMGPDAADDIVDQLTQAQKAGEKAVKLQDLTKSIAKGVAKAIPYAGAAAVGGYEAIKHL